MASKQPCVYCGDIDCPNPQNCPQRLKNMAEDAKDPLVGQPSVDEIRRKYELGEYRDTRLTKGYKLMKAYHGPPIPVNQKQLETMASGIELESKGKVVLRRKDKSRNWLLFLNGVLVKELRNARAMSFMDGWLASARFNRQ